MNQRFCLFLFASCLMLTCPLAAQPDQVLNENVDGLTVTVSLDDVPTMHSVWLSYEIKNSSDETVSFPYRYYWDFPVGLSAQLTKKSGKSLVRFGTRHVLADETLTNDLENDRVDLEPGASLKGTVNILDMVILRDQYGEAFLNPGKYVTGLSFFGNQSNLIELQIPRQ